MELELGHRKRKLVCGVSSEMRERKKGGNDEDRGRVKEGFRVYLGLEFHLWRVRIRIPTGERETVVRGTHSNIKNSEKFTNKIILE